VSINNERWDPLFSARAEYVDEVKLCPSTYSAIAEKKGPHYSLLIVFLQCFPMLARRLRFTLPNNTNTQDTLHNIYTYVQRYTENTT
jgi:hypothetical protein